jgi:subtilisin family serine protease
MIRPGVLGSVAVLVLASSVSLLSCGPGTDGVLLPETPPPARAPEGAAADLDAGKTVRVLLLLDPARVTVSPRADRVLTPSQHALRVQQFAGAKRALLGNAPAGVRVEEDYDQVPILLADISTRAAWDYLLGDPRVLRLAPDELHEAALDSSLAFIHQPQAAAEGKDGAGVSVAVLDTGTDYTRSAFGSCTAPGVPSATCRVPFARDFATEDNLTDDSGRHGTNVAAIVAGVAPGAKILALDVFNGTGASSSTIVTAINWVIANKATYNIAAMNLSLGSGGYTANCPADSMALAIDEARRAGILAAVSTGNSAFTNAISSPACAPAAVSVGAVYDGNVGGLTYSACSDATTGADQVTCFTNSASHMTMLAPGAAITAGGVTKYGTSQASPHVAGAIAVLRAAYPSETPDELVARLVNTGVQVTNARNGITKPRLHLAAAAAGCVLKVSPSSKELSADPQSFSLSVTTSASCKWSAESSNADVFAVTSGATGTGSGTVTLKASANAGASVRSGTVTVSGTGATSRTVTLTQAVDTSPPTGSISINAGAEFTQVPSVTLTLTGSDASGVSSMCVTNTTSCTSFEPFATIRAWTLATGQGLRTVRVLLKDAKGNVSQAISDTIVLDTAAPTGGTLTAQVGIGANVLNWTTASDTGSGLDRHRLVFAAGTAPASCAAGAGTVAYEGPALAYTHAGLTNGTTYAYRLCAVDKAGNMALGITASARPRPETDAPTGSLTVEGGAAFTRSATVSLSLTAMDASAVTSMCISNTATCAATAWVPYAALVPAHVLTTAQGLKTVSVWLRDEWGNTTPTPLTDTVTLDTGLPTGSTLAANFGNRSNALTWTAATDASSGVDRYRLVFAAGAAPTSCAPGVGSVAYEGPALAYTHTGLTNGTTYGYRLCAVDKAGNVAVGVTASAKPRPEADAPTGTVTLNGGAPFTTHATLNVSLAVTDASTLTEMCLSTTATCAVTAWVPFAASSTLAVATSPGSKKVSVWLRDEWGNSTATPLSSTITLDTAPPTVGTLTAAFGNQANTLSWTAATDATSGVDRYRLVFATGTAPASCASGTLAYEGANLSYTHAGLTNGTTYGYRLCAVDKAGNVAAGVTASARPRPEADAPTGTMTLNGGAAYTPNATLNVSLAGADGSSITEMCLSTTATYTSTT